MYFFINIIYLITFEDLSIVSISSQCCAFKTITDVTQVCDPTQIDGYSVKTDEETGEKQERYRHDRRQEHSVLTAKIMLSVMNENILLSSFSLLTCTFIAAPTTSPTLWATNDMSKQADKNMPNLNISGGCEVM